MIKRLCDTVLVQMALTLLMAATLCGHVSHAAKPGAAPKIPMRDFFKNPEIASFSISPDGKMLGFMKPWEQRMNVFVRPVGGGEEKRLTSNKDRDLAGYYWKGNGHIIYFRDFGGDENYHIFSVDVKTGQEKDLTPYPNVRAEIIDILEDSSAEEIMIAHNKRDAKVFDVFRLNVRTGKETKVAENDGSILSWITDHDGKLRVAVASDGVNTKVLYRDNEKQKFRLIKTMNFKESFSPLFFTPDNKRLYVTSNLGRDKEALLEYDPRTDKDLRIIAQHPDNDITSAGYSKKRKVLTAAFVTTWKSQMMPLDFEFERVTQEVEQKLPNTEIRYVSMNKNEDMLVIRTFSDRSMGAFYLYDVKKKEMKELAKIGNLPENELAQMKPIQYVSRDGLTINGYLTLPKGIPAKNLPVVINPHGGPWHRDNWRFNPEVQFLANRGYAVLQMNFRGSTTYGKKFWQASFKQWGKTMQDDITDGVNWLVDQGIANKKKICIYGGSYGGYATLAGLAFTPDVYACGVDYVGVSNMFTFMNTIPPYWKPMLDQFHEMVGHPERDKELLTAASPVLHVDKIKAPLLVVQGAKDPRVNKDESDQMVSALRKRGIDVPYIMKENEGHGFHNEENRFEFYEAMEKFLGKHIGS